METKPRTQTCEDRTRETSTWIQKHAIRCIQQGTPCHMQLCTLCYAIGTVLQMQSCLPGRCCVIQLCPPGHICTCSYVRPVQNRCSKLNALGRRNTLAIFYKVHVIMTWEHKTREYSSYTSVHARSLTRAHTCSTVMYLSAGRFLHSPGHDCICKRVRSGQCCMAHTIASDTGAPSTN